MHRQQTAFANIVGKGGIARNEQFLLFLQCFLHNQTIVSPFVHIFDIISLFAAEFEKPKICLPGKGFSIYVHLDLLYPQQKKFGGVYWSDLVLPFGLSIPGHIFQTLQPINLNCTHWWNSK